MSFTIFDPATVADLLGAEPPPERGLPIPMTDEALDWAQRTFPDAEPRDWYGFAAIVGAHALGWSDPWDLLSLEHPKDVAALHLIRQARGDLGDSIIESVHVDADGRHAPPGMSLEEWTQWLFARLVQHYFRIETVEERDATEKNN